MNEKIMKIYEKNENIIFEDFNDFEMILEFKNFRRYSKHIFCREMLH